MNKRLDQIRDRSDVRVASKQAAGVREWYDIAYLLELLETKLCKKCKTKIEEDD